MLMSCNTQPKLDRFTDNETIRRANIFLTPSNSFARMTQTRSTVENVYWGASICTDLIKFYFRPKSKSRVGVKRQDFN